jgi:7-carboxy-7-deazaguanine synthase
MVLGSSADQTGALLISEIFGPTLQGEGRQQGQPCAFVRLGGCNLTCSFCDTPYTWAFTDRQVAKHEGGKKYDPKQELRRMDAVDVAAAVRKILPSGGLVVFSGGEPMLQQAKIVQVMGELGGLPYYRFAVETAGTIAPSGDIRTLVVSDRFTTDRDPFLQLTVSPKLENSGNDRKKSEVPDAIRAYNTLGADFKFVVDGPTILLFIEEFVKHYGIDSDRVWLMPEGTRRESLLEIGPRVANCALSNGWNFTQRMHVLLWGNERGH